MIEVAAAALLLSSLSAPLNRGGNCTQHGEVNVKGVSEHDVRTIIELYIKGKTPLVPNSILVVPDKLVFSPMCSFSV